ncbi:MAG TPA: ATP-binding protein [Alphaproteobacteria bacterium]|nr:ATP-binding protein [Alphaproteobacteria bacterium]
MLSRLMPDRLSQWMAALVVGGILLTQGLALSLYHFDRVRSLETAESRQAAQCLAGFAQVLGPESPDRRAMMMRRLMFHHGFGPPPDLGHPPLGEPPLGAPPLGAPPPGEPPPNFDIQLPDAGDMPGGPRPGLGRHAMMELIRTQGTLPDGTKLTLDTRSTIDRLFTPSFAAYIGALLAVALLGSIWAVTLATRPLRRLSEAADRFGADVNAAPMPVAGPREVRQAAAAFNRMQQRLRQFILDRTRMLAAISHDLRTPLTRMRLRAEMIDDGEQRDRMLGDLHEMEEMIGATMAFAREESSEEQSEPVALDRLLDTIVDDAVETGQPVTKGLIEPVTTRVRPRALKRALVNIVENAVRYGEGAAVSLARSGDEARIRIVDHGPGIPEAERDAVLRPFYRCEGSRSRDTGGIGLGLSIASDTITAHGGRLILSETSGGGLTVEVRLPVSL